jgi:uncharacterized membrane protein YkvA (DUF1232 family)
VQAYGPPARRHSWHGVARRARTARKVVPVPWWLSSLVGLVAGVVLVWVALVVVLARAGKRRPALAEIARLLPDVVRLVSRLARDRSLPWAVRLRLWLLLGYLLSPIDVVPDFIPVAGYADDAVMVALVLRSVVRRAGAETLHRHWPGTPDGFAAVRLLAGIADTRTAT